MKCIFAGLVPVFLAFSGGGLSAQNLEFTSSADTEGVSGTLGTLRQVESGGDNGLLTYVMWGERSDDPCHIVTRATRLNGTTRDSELFADCHNNSNRQFSTSGSRRIINYTADDHVVTGVRACMNSGNNKIKGIMLIGERLGCVLGEEDSYWVLGSDRSHFRQGGSDHTLRSTPAPRLVQCGSTQARHVTGNAQINCNSRWDSVEMCPTGEVVTGLGISTRSGNNGRTIIQGIAPVCRRIARVGG